MTAGNVQSTGIRTPDQRLRVFISSTLGELSEERAAVSRAISALGLTPVMFELGARPHPPRELYRAYLAQSDIFIGLYWQRYGWIAPDMDISGLQDEFELSRSLPRLLYVKTPAAEREPRLTALLERIRDEAATSYRAFRTARELGRLVRDDLAVMVSERFAARDAASTASLSAGRLARRSLPVETTSLIGRAQVIEEVSRLFEAPETRLVTLAGPGGIGKTRLAAAVGERVGAHFPSGVAFVSLASISTPDLVLPSIARVVGAELAGTRSPLDALVEHLGDLACLLVLDNLEHVVACARDLDDLLARCPGLKILATSRRVLRLRVEREYPVAALSVPSASGDLDLGLVASSSAVELFIDRARAVRHDFALTPANAHAVVEIARRLEGIPLAIELAAARARLLDPDALLARLTTSLDALGVGPVDLPERQRTLRATVEWSVGLLDEAEARMLHILAVFVDGWTIDAATYVADLGEERALDLLDGLVGHSLVQVDTSDSGPRFRLLETVREFIVDRLATDSDLADVRRRHADYFRDLAERADRPLREAQPEWVKRLEAEVGNTRSAIRWLIARDMQPLPRLFRILFMFWFLRDHLVEAQSWIHELLSDTSSFEHQRQAELNWVAAVTFSELGDYTEALAAGERLRPLLGEIDDLYLQAVSHLAMLWIATFLDDFDDALREASLGYRLLSHKDEPVWAAIATTNLGALEIALGHRNTGLFHLIEGRNQQPSAGWFATSIGWFTTSQLATVAVTEGRLDDARAFLDEGLGMGMDEVNTRGLSMLLAAAARLALAEGNAHRSAVALGAAEGVRRRVGLRLYAVLQRAESELMNELKQTLGADRFNEAFNRGSRLNRREAMAIIREQDANVLGW
jgi:predicted ATPase